MADALADPAAADTAKPSPAAVASAIELIGIDKRFGTVHANRHIDFAVERGTIHGIVGENGAGKSTLMKILYGFYQADSGEIRVGGKALRIDNPDDAISAGIGMVHQHFMLVENFTVLENLLLGAEDRFWIAESLKSARKLLHEIEQSYGLQVDPDAVVGELSVGQQQRVEILKILFRGAEIIILDEPTAVLTPQETEDLFRILERLKGEGKTIILITHKLQEIMAITNRVTVMRDGAVVGNVATENTSREQLAEMMVGRQVLLRVEKGPAQPGETVLSVSGLTVTDEQGRALVQEMNLEVAAGEVLGVAGVAGNGQSELIEALAGLRPQTTSGSVVLRGKEIVGASRKQAIHNLRDIGICHVPEDRLKMGVVVPFDASETAILGYHDDPAYNGFFVSQRGAIVRNCGRLMQAFDVRPAEPLWRTGSFSGGNQQKLVLAREIDRNPALLLVGQPTRGVDIGAIEFIHRRLIEMRDAGTAILLISAELEEILALSDRIVVMHDGRIVGAMPAAGADRQTIGLMMAGIAEPSE